MTDAFLYFDKNNYIAKRIESSDIFLGLIGSSNKISKVKDRNKYINALLYFCYLFNDKFDNEEEMDENIKYKLAKYTFENSIDIIREIAYYIAEKYLNNIENSNLDEFNTINVSESFESIRNELIELNPNKQIELYFYKSLTDNKVRFPFTDLFDKYVFGTNKNELNFDKMIIDKMIHETNEIDVQKMKPKMTIANKYQLVELISGKDGPIETDNSQVWRASFRRGSTIIPVAVKFISMDYFDSPEMQKALGINKKDEFDPTKFNDKKVNEILRRENRDYQNRIFLSDYKYMSTYKEVGFSMLSSSCYLIQDYYSEGNLQQCLTKLISRIETINELFLMMMDFNKRGYTFNNLNPFHVVMKYEKNVEVFGLIDFTRVLPIAESTDNFQKHGFASLNNMEGGALYPYDDIESLLYLCDFIISGQIHKFENPDEEYENKTSLELYSKGIAKLIRKIREMRQNDNYVSQGKPYKTTEVGEIVENIYDEFFQYVEEWESKLKDIKTIPDAVNTDASEEVLKLILTDMAGYEPFEDLNNTRMNELAIKILNTILYDSKYPIHEQEAIDQFIEYHQEN